MQVVPDLSPPHIIQHQQELVPFQETLHHGLEQSPALCSTVTSPGAGDDIPEKIRLRELLGHEHHMKVNVKDTDMLEIVPSWRIH